jgi:hypothetical protein
MGWDCDAVAFGCMVVNLLQRGAEVNVSAANFTEADGGIGGLFELGPALGTLERELDLAVGDWGHGYVGARRWELKDGLKYPGHGEFGVEEFPTALEFVDGDGPGIPSTGLDAVHDQSVENGLLGGCQSAEFTAEDAADVLKQCLVLGMLVVGYDRFGCGDG